ncbi:MAG: PASTA domain-containing protein [Oscillospiraceae bacterium]|jgi:hypothetical protein|nr:PASTA domain-containing protein [Oscillospiraceae bacterium]
MKPDFDHIKKNYKPKEFAPRVKNALDRDKKVPLALGLLVLAVVIVVVVCFVSAGKPVDKGETLNIESIRNHLKEYAYLVGVSPEETTEDESLDDNAADGETDADVFDNDDIADNDDDDAIDDNEANDEQETEAATTSSGNAAISLNGAALTLSVNSFSYDGTAKKPNVAVKLSGQNVNAANYTVKYANNINAGSATVTVTGKNGYSGSLSAKYTIAKADLSKLKLKWTNQTYRVYTGKELTPPDISLSSGVKLIRGTDYTITAISNNTKVGTAKFTITGKGNYTGTKDSSFDIKRLSVPDLKGKSQAEAESSLKALGLKSTVKKAFSDTVKSGSVVQTSPKSGDSVTAGDTVTIYISSGSNPNKVTIPQLGATLTSGKYKGYTRAQAESALDKLGMGTEVIYIDSTVTKGLVVRTSPSSGKVVEKGDLVTIYVSNGPDDDD